MNAEVAAVIVGTVVNGSLIAVVGAGFVLVMRATKVMSFAQGAFVLTGALFLYWATDAGLPFYAAVAATLVAGFVLAALVFRLVLSRLAGAPPLVSAIATIAIAGLAEAIVNLWYGSNPIQISNSPLSLAAIQWPGGFEVNSVDIFSVALALLAFLAIFAILRFSRLGLNMRLVADEPLLAEFNGVRIGRVSMMSWGFAGAMASIAGVSFALATQSSPAEFTSLGLDAFPAILLGGLDSVAGSLIGGFVIAAISQIVQLKLGGQWNEVVSYSILLAILAVRPQGLLGTLEVTRL
jgi:branched-chain amino acid transport system permease protein